MKEILQKLASRKFQALLAIIITSVGTLIGMPENKVAVIIALCGAVLAAISYIFAEAMVDKAAVGLTQPEISDAEMEETIHDLQVALRSKGAERYDAEE